MESDNWLDKGLEGFIPYKQKNNWQLNVKLPENSEGKLKC